MAIMRPEYTDAPFLLAAYLADCASYAISAREKGTWFTRLPKDGYMDSTDWSGPFETEQDARDFIEITYGVNPYTGDDLLDD